LARFPEPIAFLFRNPPHSKIGSAAVHEHEIYPRSVQAEIHGENKNSASKGIRVTLVIVVINSSLQPEASPVPTADIVATLRRGFSK
jgi:hypothetical protein